MNTQEWESLENVLRKCVNSFGSMYFEDRTGVGEIIAPLAIENNPMTKYHIQDLARGFGREHNSRLIRQWIKSQQEIERRITSDKFVSGVTYFDDIREFPRWPALQTEQAEALFNLCIRAIEFFQEQPAAMILFPNLVIHGSRALYWFESLVHRSGYELHGTALRQRFRNINPGFNLHVVSVSEIPAKHELLNYEEERRKIGVLFTYNDHL